ncbi:hypothetical protein HanPI659440_Chr12g0456461 [Helianthus annuus]|nr:hypothetical protein HanPI659440_Chr12g0456461 [Helianthus annuus]
MCPTPGPILLGYVSGNYLLGIGYTIPVGVGYIPHSSLDEYVAHWFGLNQSKYQWALDDYYESKGSDKVDAQVTHAAPKAQRV